MSGDSLTAPEVGLLLKMSAERVRRLVLKGELAGECVAGRWVIQAASIGAYRHRQAAREAAHEPVPTA